MTTTVIQWKGTNLCMDFYCPACEGHSHFDGFFAYYVKCPHCKTLFKMPTDVSVTRAESAGDMPYLCGEP